MIFVRPELQGEAVVEIPYGGIIDFNLSFACLDVAFSGRWHSVEEPWADRDVVDVDPWNAIGVFDTDFQCE